MSKPVGGEGAQTVIRVPASGTYHRAYRVGEAVLTNESCNLDDADDLEDVGALPPDVDHKALCERCLLQKQPQEEEPS